ncbi:hypothetical protein MnTg02_02261 [bacterium MnTg02]|nr:hypothetical protein MnTg02_02261 [bacterium MnTg02]
MLFCSSANANGAPPEPVPAKAGAGLTGAHKFPLRHSANLAMPGQRSTIVRFEPKRRRLSPSPPGGEGFAP